MVSPSVRKAVSSLKLADPSFDTPGPIDLLIGADVFPLLVTGGSMEGPPVALDSVFGWILMGRVPFKPAPADSQSFTVSLFCSSPPLGEVIKKFWEVEEYPTTKHHSPEDMRCERMFVESHKRMEDGRFSVCLPFDTSPELGDTRAQAINRLLGLERRLKGNPDVSAMYSDFMKDYLVAGHMEKVPPEQIHSVPAYYIPHHAVVKPDSSTTKLRVVFDASDKGSTGRSLNDCLLTGPKLQREIIDVLLGFRSHAIVFTADIKQMYRQISIHQMHQDYQRIVWRSCDTDPVEDFRLRTVTYGVSAAPYLALRTIQQLARDEAAAFPLASKVLLSDIYVDDMVTGSSSIDSALDVQRELLSCLAKGGFKLRKFMINHPALLDWLPHEDVETPQMLSFDPDCQAIIKVLGLQWSPGSDTFAYKIEESSNHATKRTILSTIARIFDPLGWLCPLLMFAKLLLQILWLQTIDWDADLPSELADRWQKFKQELPCLTALAIPRHIQGSEGCVYEIHGFSDSSKTGFAAVVYLRIIESNNKIHTHLLIGKSKIAPVKVQSLPRLELCGALLLARLLKRVVATYQKEFSLSSVTAWMDSQVVLAWINSSPHQLKTFVANRVSELQDLTSSSWWRHVPSEHNPADCASRGLLPTQLLNHHLWWTGPVWLQEQTQYWPLKSQHAVEADPVLLEHKVVTLEAMTHNHDIEQLMTRFSHLTKLLRVTAFMLRFVHNVRTSHSAPVYGSLTPLELDHALRLLLLRTQSSSFQKDIDALRRARCTSSQIRKLVPLLDDHGLIRVGGRLPQATIPFEHKHPVLLPKSDPLTDLIIRHYHDKNNHPGVQTLRGILREQFWILGDKDAITRLLRTCLRCFRQRPSFAQPKMGDLPAMRVQQIKPFAKSGVDYAGPFPIKLARLRRAPILKAYLCIFVCCATKAVHVELASDLSTEAFLAAYKRFIGRRGRSSDIYSDCGTNFVGAHNHLKEVQQLVSSPVHQQAITDVVSQLGITWHFNPPAAPHFGGLWEAAVKSFKTHLQKVIGEQVSTYEELYSVLVQVEATLNSRPLCPLSSDPNDVNALTPGHFLTLEPLVALPEPDLQSVPLNHLNRWQLVERLHQDFWHRWHRDYLHTLQQRNKWHKPATPLVPHQLVLLKDERSPPLQWRLGRIQDLHPGKDGVTRVATVCTTTGSLKRQVVKLCPLPLC
ncbi:uncharacterized protein LOC134538623 [Bacillus rossius redtenbacheri]|uniref:uncharacterized protein LOC134538623 n=1 Tax=Bacillus rossius redtenbacheri TaxID=93214 RepID=UPI002FDC9A42